MKISILKNQRQLIFLSFILGLILGAILTWFVLGTTVFSPTNPLEENVVLSTETINTITLNSIVVENQLAGNTVVVKEVVFVTPGWVVIHEERAGVAGNALGAQRFDVGTSTGMVDLLRDTEVGNKYYAVLYQDNGDKGFNLEEDTPLNDISGNFILADFETVRFDRKTE